MMNTIRCCISCILPCGPLDVIRIIHSNGYIEEISGTILASEVMKANPRHVLQKPASSFYSDEGVVVCPKIIILSPEVELQRGKVYFLVPTSSLPSIHKEDCSKSSSSSTPLTKMCHRKRGHVASWQPRLKTISEAAYNA